MSSLILQHISLPDWEQHFDRLTARIAPHFARPLTHEQAKAYLKGLLSNVERKNGWQLAEQVGQQNPYRLQHLLDRAVWDQNAVRDEVQRYLLEYLADEQGVFVIDETGFLKKGDKSVGVKRQYSGTAGGLDNCQIGVFLGYATSHGHALLDCALYLPQEWADDPDRCEEAKIPDAVTFATKPKLAQDLLAHALDAKVTASWVTGDSVYGEDPALRDFLETRRLAYILAVRNDHRFSWEGGQIRALTLTARLLATSWQRLSAGDGAKGPRLFDWAYLPLDAIEAEGFAAGMLVRRSISDPTDLAYYAVFAPQGTPLAQLVAVAGTRWTIETAFERAKGEVGLDQYEVRSWHGWYRHMTLCLLAQAFLAVLRCEQRSLPEKGGPTHPRHSLRNFLQSRGLSCP